MARVGSLLESISLKAAYIIFFITSVSTEWPCFENIQQEAAHLLSVPAYAHNVYASSAKGPLCVVST